MGRRTHEELGQGCGLTTPHGNDNEGGPEGRAPAGGSAIARGGDVKTWQRLNLGGGLDSGGEGAIQVEEDSAGQGQLSERRPTLVTKVAMVARGRGHSGEEEARRGKGEIEEVNERGGQLLLMALTREGRKGGHRLVAAMSPAVEWQRGGQDSDGEGAVQAEDDDNGSWTVVGEEANISHKSDGGSCQRKRAAKRGIGVWRKWRNQGCEGERGGQLLLTVTMREGWKGGHRPAQHYCRSWR